RSRRGGFGGLARRRNVLLGALGFLLRRGRRISRKLADEDARELDRAVVVLEDERPARGNPWKMRVLDHALAVEIDRHAIDCKRDEGAVPAAGRVIGAQLRSRALANLRGRLRRPAIAVDLPRTDRMAPDVHLGALASAKEDAAIARV